MSPRIGIPVPTSSDLEYNRRSWPQYATAVERSGGEPVEITLSSPELWREVAAMCDGFVLPGSPADVLPSRYGQDTDPFTSPADLPREACDDALLRAAENNGKPVLGVCFGLQSMNVWRGGSLVQHLTPMPVNHSAGREVAIAHTTLIARHSRLGRLLDPAEAQEQGEFLRLPVNTSHHQAISAPGDSFIVVARSPEDGVIEAIETVPNDVNDQPRLTLLGVQWHPERSYDISASSRALFGWLIAEALVRSGPQVLSASRSS